MSVGETVYINGDFARADTASVSVFDRGFLMAHAAYEVTAVYGGALIDFDQHAERLARTLAGIEIPNPWSVETLKALHIELMRRNGMDEGLVYLQVTAGAYGDRDFAGPETFDPALFMFVARKALIGETARTGLRAISLPDTRWTRRDMKTTQLLSQALAYRQAREAGCETAWMYEDGWVTEAASANAWIVTADGGLVTRDLSPALLPGVTRASVRRVMEAAGRRIEERAFTLAEAKAAAEAFTTSTGVVIAPVLSLDGDPIGEGRPGPVTRAVQRHYYEHMGVDVAAVAPWALEE